MRGSAAPSRVGAHCMPVSGVGANRHLGFVPIPRRLTTRHHQGMDDDTLAALRQTAQHRLHFIALIAARLEGPEDQPDIRREAAAILRQLVEDARAE